LNCGSDLSAPDDAEPPMQHSPKKEKPASLSVVKKEQAVALLASAALLIAFSALGYQGLTSGKKGFALSGAAGEGAQPESQVSAAQNPSVNSRAAAPETQAPPAPKVITDKAILEKLDVLKSQFAKETSSEKRRIAALAVSETYIEAGRLDLGGEWSKLAFEATNPKEPKLLLRAANLYDDAKLHSIAADLYAQYLELEPQNADARVDYAISLLNQGLQREGVTQMRRVVDEHPKHQKANLNLGILYAQIERWDDAKKLWQTARDLNPLNDAGQRAQDLLQRYGANQ
jgi:tetratricopeptide (TPR) repeat protein